MATILLVEDDKSSLDYVVALLQRKSHLVLPSLTITQAWKWLEEYVTVDIVFLDSDLGDQKGWDFLSQLRQNAILRTIPVVVYTAHSEKREVLRYLDLKVQHYLVKPYDIFKLEEQIERAISYNWVKSLFCNFQEVCAKFNLSQQEYLQCLQETICNIDEAHNQMVADAVIGNCEEIAAVLQSLRAKTEKAGFLALEEILVGIESAAHRNDTTEVQQYLAMFPGLLKILDRRTQTLYGVSLRCA